MQSAVRPGYDDGGGVSLKTGKRILIGVVLILLSFLLGACGRQQIPTQTQAFSFDRAHSDTLLIVRVTELRDKPQRAGYQLAECETIWNDSKYDLVYFHVEKFPDLQPGQIHLLYPVSVGGAYEANNGITMDENGCFFVNYYPNSSGLRMIDNYNKSIYENNGKQDSVQSMPTEYPEGYVTLDELIAF